MIASPEHDEQRVAIITGTSQGIGAGLAKAYRERGYAVIATADRRAIVAKRHPSRSSEREVVTEAGRARGGERAATRHQTRGAPTKSCRLRSEHDAIVLGGGSSEAGEWLHLYPLLAVSGGRYSAMGGGVPLTSEGGEMIAGVGVSGGTTAQDIAIVEAAIS